MNDYRATISQQVRRSPSVVAPGGFLQPWNTPEGATVQKDWVQAYIDAGYGFQVTVGAFSTPVTGGGAGTVLDQDQPELVLSVPSGVAIWLYRVTAQCLTPLIATDADESEILLALDKDTASNAGSGTGTVETPLNLRMNNNNTSSVTAVSANTSNITNPTLDMELARAIVVGDVQGTAANALWGQLALNYEPKRIPLLVGPCAVYLYWGGTVATTGFAQAEWIEPPASIVDDLLGL